MSSDIQEDLPTTTETKDETSSVVDTATDLMLDSTIPAPIRRNAFKALDRLCSALIDVPVGYLERRSAEKRAVSEANVKLTREAADQIAQQMKIDPEFPQRASNTFAKRILREQYNLEKILGLAADILKRKQYDNPKDSQVANESEDTISEDWFNIFEKEASQKSTEEVQHRFAQVLAGEIEKPGAYSIKAVKILGELDQNIAILFKKFCSACVVLGVPNNEHIIDARVSSLGGNAGSNALSKYELAFDQLNLLNEYDLIISDYDSWRDYNVCLMENNPFGFFLPFQHQGKSWALLPSSHRESKSEFRLAGVALSHVGRELFRIVEQDPMPEYTEDLKKFFAGQNLQMVEVP